MSGGMEGEGYVWGGIEVDQVSSGIPRLLSPS